MVKVTVGLQINIRNAADPLYRIVCHRQHPGTGHYRMTIIPLQIRHTELHLHNLADAPDRLAVNSRQSLQAGN